MKLNLHLHYDSAITFLSIYPREIKTYFFKQNCMIISMAVLLIIVQNWGNIHQEKNEYRN